MLQIRIHGRGGQGARVACEILAAAFARAGREVRVVAAGTGERAPVDHVVVLDPALLPDVAPGSLRAGGHVVVNAPAALCSRAPGGTRVVDVDASAIAARAGLGSIVSTAMLGAFAAATGLLSLDDLRAAVDAGSPTKREANVTACVAGYLTVAGAIAPSGRSLVRG